MKLFEERQVDRPVIVFVIMTEGKEKLGEAVVLRAFAVFDRGIVVHLFKVIDRDAVQVYMAVFDLLLQGFMKNTAAVRQLFPVLLTVVIQYFVHPRIPL